MMKLLIIVVPLVISFPAY
ncbi:TPA: type I toxin-antitoxin system Ibs family toxin [Escherichia coli]|nr:type I toxin-antitoxin system Ibs family toxin [Escherichia coli]EFN4321432.1 type I toxin-antitoxin system Ibs family toxin [Escherichia coli]EGN8893138.1 type I toxin-antitoxin system Ibs family toxin [Escherichia coli]EGT2552126.1 type I toxin-antitoxin system Ibs family toxin [Escherichia coli]EJC0755985.1 type I toxin-antitoxin system Ibs family toxin [Escherichia coli]EJM7965277.1 type I toxin-antitoxin system Ibs family toxin [Escherichia coli]